MAALSPRLQKTQEELKALFLYGKKKQILDGFRAEAGKQDLDPWNYILKIGYTYGAEIFSDVEDKYKLKAVAAIKRINAAQKRLDNEWILYAARLMVITQWPAETGRDANINLDFIYSVYDGTTDSYQIFDRALSMWEVLYRHFKVWWRKNSMELTEEQYEEVFRI
jgi:hypothetical protein